MALVQCPNCKIQVTAVSARCFSCGYPMPRQAVAAPPKKRKSLTRAYALGGVLVIAGFVLQPWIGPTALEILIVLGVLMILGSIIARIFMRWMDKPIEP